MTYCSAGITSRSKAGVYNDLLAVNILRSVAFHLVSSYFLFIRFSSYSRILKSAQFVLTAFDSLRVAWDPWARINPLLILAAPSFFSSQAGDMVNRIMKWLVLFRRNMIHLMYHHVRKKLIKRRHLIGCGRVNHFTKCPFLKHVVRIMPGHLQTRNINCRKWLDCSRQYNRTINKIMVFFMIGCPVSY